MKKILTTVSLLFMVSAFCQGQSMDQSISYFDFFNKQHGAIVQQNLNYLQVMVHSEDIKEIAIKRIALLELINEANSQLNQLPEYDKDAGLKMAMKNVLSIYKKSYQGAYVEIEALKLESSQSFELMTAYIEKQNEAEKELGEASRLFLEAQKTFAEANNIVLMVAQPSSEIEQLNALNTYQRKLFLSSFRLIKLNVEFLDAIPTADEKTLNDTQQKLVLASNEEIAKINKTPAFNDNTAYRDAVLRQAKIIHTLANVDYPILIKGATNSGHLTEEEANNYNRVITKINTTLNPTMEEVNISLQGLLRDNVPKPAHKGVRQI